MPQCSRQLPLRLHKLPRLQPCRLHRPWLGPPCHLLSLRSRCARPHDPSACSCGRLPLRQYPSQALPGPSHHVVAGMAARTSKHMSGANVEPSAGYAETERKSVGSLTFLCAGRSHSLHPCPWASLLPMEASQIRRQRSGPQLALLLGHREETQRPSLQQQVAHCCPIAKLSPVMPPRLSAEQCSSGTCSRTYLAACICPHRLWRTLCASVSMPNCEWHH